ncbi:MAG: RagB/SusD family nutrient uptake outer membrane protein [Bacteroidota bacterium]
MTINIKIPIAILVLVFLISTSCKKFLDEKSDKKLVIPSTLADLQALLDNSNTLVLNDPYAPEFCSDNIYLLTPSWLSLPDYVRGMYIWNKDNIFEPTTNDWSSLYRKVYVTNTVLETLQKIEKVASNEEEWNNIKGQALMIRGKSFLCAVLIWAPAYDSTSANSDMGIPLRLNTDLAETAVRPSVQQTYVQAISDLQASIPLLPKRGIHQIRACKAAAYGLLARTYLSMRNYPKSGLYADSSLQINATLLNYNTVSISPTFPIALFNTEINYYTTFSNTVFTNSYGRVDSLLYASYAANDCRKTLFFSANTDGSFGFRGSYTASAAGFGGVASDEVYLTRAEAFARAGMTNEALTDLNTLLQARIKTGTFTPVTASGSSDALAKILLERRKELLWRGLRWMDIKRLNKEGAGITLKRIVNNTVYTLAPNALGFALPIPEYVINLSGMPQNPR